MKYYIVNNEDLSIKSVECDGCRPDPCYQPSGEMHGSIYLHGGREKCHTNLIDAIFDIIDHIDDRAHSAMLGLRNVSDAVSDLRDFFYKEKNK